MPAAVFLSYARNSSAPDARALKIAVGDDAFLDATDIEDGAAFPTALIESLLGARVVVVFLSESYYAREYCWREFSAAISPLTMGSPSAPEQDHLRHIIVALPKSKLNLDDLPPSLRSQNWPHANDTARLHALTLERLKQLPNTLGERLGPNRHIVLSRLRDECALPLPCGIDPRTPKYNLNIPPTLGDQFVGRGLDLWRIHNVLSPSSTSPVTVSLTGAVEGLAGVGKTRIAAEYVHRFGARCFPGGIFWLNADVSTESLEVQFHGILRAIRPETTPDLLRFRESGRDVRSELHEAFDSLNPRNPALLVIDNIPEGTAREPPPSLEHFCPGLGRITLLTTSRQRMGHSVGIRGVELKTLTRDAAVMLLTSNVDFSSLEQWEWSEISSAVGCLPLALTLLNAALSLGGLSPKELLQRFRQSTPTIELDRLSQDLRLQVQPGTVRGVTEALLISYNRLKPEWQRAARLLAHLSPEPLPLAIVTAFHELDSSEVRSALLGHSVVEKVSLIQGVEMFGSIHRIVADFLRQQSLPSPDDALDACRAMARIYTPEECRNPKNWAALDLCRPHFEALFKRAATVASGLGERAADIVRLGTTLGTFLDARGSNSSALAVLRTTHQISSRELGEQLGAAAQAMDAFVYSLRSNQDFAAAQRIAEHTLAIRKRLLGNDHRDTLVSLSSVAQGLQENGQYSRALELMQDVLSRRSSLLGDKHPETITAMNHVAVLQQLLHDYSSARETFGRLVSLSKEVYGGDSTYAMTFQHNLASVLADLGELDSARKQYEELLAAMVNVLGEDHPKVLYTADGLARVLDKQGFSQEALKVWDRALLAAKEKLGEDHPTTLTMMEGVAASLQVRGEFEVSREIRKEILGIRKRSLGDSHMLTIVASCNLARVLPDREHARRLQEAGVDALRALLGEDNDYTLTVLNDLSDTLRNMGDLRAALEVKERVFVLTERKFGRDHPKTLDAVSGVSSILRIAGEFRAARRLAERAVRVACNLFGSDNAITLRYSNDLAIIVADQGDLQTAQKLMRETMEATRRLLGEDNPDTLKAISNLASIESDLGNWNHACELNRRALGIARRLFGAEHPLTLDITSNLAVELDSLGDQEARALHEAVLAVRRRVLGPRHPETVLSIWNLYTCVRERGDPIALELLGDLRWLLECEPSQLGVQLGRIRERVGELLP